MITDKQVLCELHRCGTEEIIRITKDRVLIGSHRHCDVTIKSATVAPVNCQLLYVDGSWFVRNLADISQTKVNGRDELEATLSAGDVLWIGSTRKYVVVFPGSEPEPAGMHQTEDAEAPAFIMLRSGQHWSEPIQLSPVHTIGRGENNSTRIPDDAQCSREHCEIVQDEERWFIRDLGSQNGTRVNGKLAKTPVELRNHDLILVGDSNLMFRVSQISTGETSYGLDDTSVC